VRTWEGEAVSDDLENEPAGMPSDGIAIGGSIPWLTVALLIEAEDLDPDEITRLLNIEPDQVQRKGVALLPHDGQPRRVPWMGTWSISLRPEQAPGCDADNAIAKLLDRINVSLPAWHSALAGARARIYLGLALDDFNRGFGFDPLLLRRMADLGVLVDVDIHSGEGVAEAARATGTSLSRILNGGPWPEGAGCPPRWPIGKPPAETSAGPIRWSRVSLSIYADDLDPDRISRLLGIEPDLEQRKGVPMPPTRKGRPGRIPGIGMWSIRLYSEEAPGCDLETAITEVLNLITVPDETWQEARSGTTARIFAKLDLDKPGLGFRLSSALIGRAAGLDISLDFDVYYDIDDETG
jgi:Domain of unknown function (DUF4279)